MKPASLKLGLIGDPVGHSLSPAIHAAALEAAGLDGSYKPIQVSPKDLPLVVTDLASAGFRGYNVTIPHKVSIVPLLAGVDRAAAQAGAVNTVVIDGGSSRGHNTDIGGIMAVLDAHVGLRSGEAMVLGAGGAARATVIALQERGMRVTIAARDVERARSAFPHIGSIHSLATPAQLQDNLDRCDIVINATAAGMGRPEDGPLPDGCTLRPGIVVADMVYSPRRTRLLRDAEAAGARTIEGIEFLLAQAAKSFECWTGIRPDLSVMRDACSSSPTKIGAA